MFNNVDAELKRKGMTRGNLATALEMSPSTMSLKLNGKSPISLEEARKIQAILAVDLTLDELFLAFNALNTQ